MRKRFFSLILSLFLLISVVCSLPAAQAPSAATQSIQPAIDKILKAYPDGSYFSKNKRACTSAGHTTANCYRYRLYNRCVGFTRMATAKLYGKDTVGYNFCWGGQHLFQ